MKVTAASKAKDVSNKAFLLFSCILFLIISLVTTAAYTIAARQINLSFVEQQLAIASETMKLRLATTVNSEILLVRKMADTPVIQQYFKNPSDPDLELRARQEFAIYEEYFRDKIVFYVNDIDKIFYSTGNKPYLLDPNDPESYWYNLTLYRTEQYNLNINYNPDLKQINLWVNVPVFTESEYGIKKPTGMLGTGINLTDFSDFIASAFREFDLNITPYMFNKFHEITSAMDYNLVHNKVRLDIHLGDAGLELLKAADMLPDAASRSFIYGNNMYLLSSIPEMKWYLAVSYPLPGILALNRPMNIIFFGMLLLILVMFVVINVFVAHSEKTLTEQNVQLLEANRKAEAASRAKSDFLARMSHEIRTPMNAITGMSELLLRGNLKEQDRSHVLDIKRAASILIAIINDILDFSKIEAGRLEIVPVKYILSSLVNDVVSIITPRLKEKSIQLITNIESSIPDSLVGDDVRLRQILLNLLSNAVKFTAEGHISVTITEDRKGSHFQNSAGADRKSDENGLEKIRLKIAVADTGRGIKKDDQEKLFRDFVQVDMKKYQDVEGTGLGLAIARKLCIAMGGDISVESEYGKGSTFSVIIPQSIYTEDHNAPIDTLPEKKEIPFEKNKETGTKISLKGVRLLVVDDILINLKVIEGLLETYNAKVDTSLSGKEAIELVKNNDYSLIFLDYMMPDMDGIETLAAIRAWENEHEKTQVPIIALTANVLSGMKEMFIENGFSDFLAKPIDVLKLDEILVTWIKERA